ncbi:MAG: hypothetical protein VYC91_08025 [Acidobacteriota bacterium]|nr:hypothetical protein [Acidobacteriota bacterium]
MLPGMGRSDHHRNRRQFIPPVCLDHLVDFVPPREAPLTLILQTDQGEVRFQGKMGPRVVHAGWEPRDQVEIGLLGIEFQEPQQAVEEKPGRLLPPRSGNDD